jgi:hypothetical protein
VIDNNCEMFLLIRMNRYKLKKFLHLRGKRAEGGGLDAKKKWTQIRKCSLRDRFDEIRPGKSGRDK